MHGYLRLMPPRVRESKLKLPSQAVCVVVHGCGQTASHSQYGMWDLELNCSNCELCKTCMMLGSGVKLHRTIRTPVFLVFTQHFPEKRTTTHVGWLFPQQPSKGWQISRSSDLPLHPAPYFRSQGPMFDAGGVVL